MGKNDKETVCPFGKYLCDDGRCYAREVFNIQAERGGDKDAVPVKGRAAGPYWPEKGWNSLVKRTLGLSSKCREGDALRERVHQVDQEKRKRGEIR